MYMMLEKQLRYQYTNSWNTRRISVVGCVVRHVFTFVLPEPVEATEVKRVRVVDVVAVTTTGLVVLGTVRPADLRTLAVEGCGVDARTHQAKADHQDTDHEEPVVG